LTAYHIGTGILWQIGELLNYYGGAITAVATVAIGCFIYTLWRATTEQARLTRDSIELARQEFVSTHRPRLHIRLLTLRPLEPGKVIALQYELVNIGDTDATLIKCETNFEIAPIGIREPILDANERGAGRKVVAGESLLILAESTIVHAPEWHLANVNGLIRIRGNIAYFDDNGVRRHTAFFRMPPLACHPRMFLASTGLMIPTAITRISKRTQVRNCRKCDS
jgi:hypothetical protein